MRGLYAAGIRDAAHPEYWSGRLDDRSESGDVAPCSSAFWNGRFRDARPEAAMWPALLSCLVHSFMICRTWAACEILTGKSAFDGEDIPDILSGVLHTTFHQILRVFHHLGGH